VERAAVWAHRSADDHDPQKAQEVATAKQILQAKEVAAINKDQSIAEMNNAKAGATQATASYDLAMAQHMPANGEFEKLKSHLCGRRPHRRRGCRGRLPALADRQPAWYAKMFEEQGPDDMKSEYPSCIEECFYSSLEGSHFKRELAKARDDKRIGLPLPHDPSRPVNTFWDIGMDDENCIWFNQTDGVRHRLIDFYCNSGEGLLQARLERDARRHSGLISVNAS
jgi:hypothetical protein